VLTANLDSYRYPGWGQELSAIRQAGSCRVEPPRPVGAGDTALAPLLAAKVGRSLVFRSFGAKPRERCPRQVPRPLRARPTGRRTYRCAQSASARASRHQPPAQSMSPDDHAPGVQARQTSHSEVSLEDRSVTSRSPLDPARPRPRPATGGPARVRPSGPRTSTAPGPARDGTIPRLRPRVADRSALPRLGVSRTCCWR